MLILMSDNVASSRKYEGTSYQGNQELKKYIVESSEDNKEKDLYIQGVRTRNQWEGLSSGLYCPRLQ